MESIAEFGILRRILDLRSVTLLAAVAGALVFPVQGSAQEATPSPVACDLTPQPVTFIADLNSTPRPEITPTPLTDVPDGTEVTDPETRAQVIRVVETLTLCVNQGEVLRAFSLFDPLYLRSVIDPDAAMEAEVAIELGESFATPEVVAEEDLTVLEEVLSVRQLADGVVVVIFRTHVGSDNSQIDLFALRHVDGRWLIVDGLADVDLE